MTGLSGASLVLSCENLAGAEDKIPEWWPKKGEKPEWWPKKEEKRRLMAPHHLRVPLSKERQSGGAVAATALPWPTPSPEQAELHPVDTLDWGSLSNASIVEIMRNASDARRAELAMTEMRQRSITFCVLAMIQTSGFLVRVGLGIRGATKMCAETETEEQKRKCAVVVSGVIGSFGLATSFMAWAVTACPAPGTLSKEGVLRAACARDVSGVIAGLTASSTFAMDVGAACEKVYQQGEPASDLPVEEE